MDTISIDQFAALPVKRPTSVAEVGELVKQARAAKQGVYPVGGRTTLDVGLPPIKPGIALDTTALNAVIDYPARDMTITVQAGITLAALQAELAKEGQWLPIDVASPEKATLGGALALNQSGPRRYGYGTLRDYVIGISFVTDGGVEVKAGGRVVKNVAGYDLMKLQIGAVGTLGVVTQVTLKVKPKPEASAIVAFGCSTEALGVVLDMVHESKSRPVAVEVLNQAAWNGCDSCMDFEGDWIVFVAFEEKAAAVRWQVGMLLDGLRGTAARSLRELPDTEYLDVFTQLQLRPESQCIWKSSVLPSKVAQSLRDCIHGMPGWLIHSHALNGIFWMHGPDQYVPTPGDVKQRLAWLDNHTVTRREFFGSDGKKQLGAFGVWGKPSPAWELMRHVKKTLDPDTVFNPGRLFGDV